MMSMLIDNPVGAAARAVTLFFSMTGLLLWRLGVEFDRGWRRAEAAPPEPWEDAFFERSYREWLARRQAPRPLEVDDDTPTRERELAAA